MDAALLSIVRTEISSAVDDPDGVIHVHEPYGHSGATAHSGYEKWAQIVSPAGAVIARTQNLASGGLYFDPRNLKAALNASDSGHAPGDRTQAHFGDGSVKGDLVRCVFYPLVDERKRQMVVIVAMSPGPMNATLSTLLSVMLAALVLTACASAWVSRRLATSLSRPLEQVAATAARVNATNLAERIPSTSDLAEVNTLAGIMNAMLERVQESFLAQQAVLGIQKRFMADASHELRSPLTNLRGTVEVALRRERTGPEYRDTLGLVLSEAERLSRLVSSLLALSRHAAAAGSSDLVLAMRQSVQVHDARARASSIELCATVSGPGAFLVRSDPDQVRQVLDNLLDNALRVAPRGSRILIDVIAEKTRGGVAVTDEGPGIPVDMHSVIFEPFTRLDPARDRDAGGTGLGLSIVKSLLTACGGTVEVESQPPHGATMRAWWPRCDPDGLDSGPPEIAPAGAPPAY